MNGDRLAIRSKMEKLYCTKAWSTPARESIMEGAWSSSSRRCAKKDVNDGLRSWVISDKAPDACLRESGYLGCAG
jgi:hypothetical protein